MYYTIFQAQVTWHRQICYTDYFHKNFKCLTTSTLSLVAQSNTCKDGKYPFVEMQMFSVFL